MVRSHVPRCSLCRTRSDSPFCGLGLPALETLDRVVGVHTFGPRQAIFHAGTPAMALYVVRSGRVRVFRTWHDGEEQTLRFLGPGEILGYRPLFANEPYRASAETLTQATICIIPAATVQELVRTVPGMALALLEKMANELRISEDLMMDLLRRPVRQRVARLLLSLAGDQGHDAGTILTREYRRKDLARMAGTTPETFSRVLHAFAQAGILSLRSDRIRIRDVRLLRRAGGEPETDGLDRHRISA